MHLQMVLQVPGHAAVPGQSLQLYWSCAERTLPISPETWLPASPLIPGRREVLPDVSLEGSSYLGAAIIATFKGGKSVTLICALFFFPSA